MIARSHPGENLNGQIPLALQIPRSFIGVFRHQGQGAFLAVAALALASLRWIWSLRERWPAALGLIIVAISAIAHQFSAVAFMIGILLLAAVATRPISGT